MFGQTFFLQLDGVICKRLGPASGNQKISQVFSPRRADMGDTYLIFGEAGSSGCVRPGHLSSHSAGSRTIPSISICPYLSRTLASAFAFCAVFSVCAHTVADISDGEEKDLKHLLKPFEDIDVPER